MRILVLLLAEPSDEDEALSLNRSPGRLEFWEALLGVHSIGMSLEL
jgi:hypothetical protein